MQLNVLSGGAAQGLVTGVSAGFEATSGCRIAGTFGAIGAMKEKLLAGASADLVILSQSMVADLMHEGHLVEGTAVDIGVVYTGVAVPSGQALPDISDANALREALRQADAIFFPDPATATAGIHFTKVMRQLGVVTELASRVRNFPNGHAAMTAMAVLCGVTSIGCTQVTEILGTPGVKLAGLLPHEFELATVYTAAVAKRALNGDAARRLADVLASNEAGELRERLGFAAAR